MSAPRHSVRIGLGGTELTVSSEHPPEYTQKVAAYFDAVLARIRTSVPSVDAHRAALLAGLAITDELFQAREGDTTQAARLRGMTERLARLVPATKRGGGAKGA
ncbi:MAG TPA: cell division protein ZapA [Gemmatimonadales bacterium]|nr:cell division protein ZapA [Gemmatimonadales bacterium]